MQYRYPHPWDGQYALPDNVMDEPGLRGTITTKQRSRRSIDAPALAPPWRTGYAYPDYIKEEPIGGGVFRTKYRPRKSIDALIPRYLGADLGLGADVAQEEETTPEMNIRGGTSWLQAAQARYGTSLEMMGGVGQPINFDAGEAWIEAASERYGYPLGADPAAISRAANRTDAIGTFGKNAAAVVWRSIGKLPRSERAQTLRRAVDTLEPGLWRRVVYQSRELESRGQSADAALKQALASQMSAGLVAELVRTGTTGRVTPQSMLGAGCGMHPLGSSHSEVVKARRGRKTSTGRAPKDPYGTGTDADPWRFPPGMVDGTVRDSRIFNVPAIKKAYRSAVDRYGKIGRGQIGQEGVGAFFAQKVLRGELPFITFTLAKEAKVGAFMIPRRQKMGVYYDLRGGSMSIRKMPRKKRGYLAKLGGALKTLGKGIIAAAKMLEDLVDDIVDGVGALACGLVSSETGQLAAGYGSMAAGAPPRAGMIGAQVAASKCGGGGGGYLPPAPRMPLLPIALGGAALLAWYLMSQGKK